MLEGQKRVRFDPQLAGRKVEHGRLPGDTVVRIERTGAFRRRGQNALIATDEAHDPRAGLDRVVTKVKRALIGAPVATHEAHHERLSKVKALAVLSSDALSSSAYATEQIVIVLVTAGALALSYTAPIAVAITALLLIVGVSYRQTIKAYPRGGGSYIVTKDNLGAFPALCAGAALMTDYVLTVAVSISAGVENFVSAVPAFDPFAIEIAVAVIALMTVVNLRGVRESGTIFAAPTYLFIGTAGLMILVGLWRIVAGEPPAHDVTGDPSAYPVEAPLTFFLVLQAFASGCAALTGVEAISDGVPAFKPPEWVNARVTLTWMVGILAFLFTGISFLAIHYRVLPRPDETIISQLNRAVYGSDTPLYYLFQIAIMLILALAANTAFSDFPRLCFFLARDRFLPTQFSFQGDRLAFSTGIMVLGVLAGVLLVWFEARTEALIPLYAVGVFVSFTLSQASMVVRWWRRREPGWRTGMPINALGALTTGIVAIVIASTKFVHGAWIVIVLIPFIIANMWGINRHYRRVATQMELPTDAPPVVPLPDAPIIVPVPGLNRAVARTMSIVGGMSRNVVAVHVTDSRERAKEIRAQWEREVPGVALVTLESPYREIVDPLLAYLDAVQEQVGREVPIVVVLSEFVPRHLYEFPLHNQTALGLKARLFFRPNTIVMDVPYHLDK